MAEGPGGEQGTHLNPQHKQMSAESMVRNLSAQAEAIWPQEGELLRRYALSDDIGILDAGCGTGECSWRLAEHFPRARVLGVDIIESHLELARTRHAGFGPRLTFENRSVFELELPDGMFDLTVCRHVIQSIPHVDRVLAELVRVTKRGGWLHLIAEDYDYLHFPKSNPDPRDLWYLGPARASALGGYDLFIGRNCPPMLARLGLQDIRVDYVIVDTLRVPRETFARIMEAWRDGYEEMIAELLDIPLENARAYFDTMAATIRDPGKYAVWMVPVVSGRVP